MTNELKRSHEDMTKETTHDSSTTNSLGIPLMLSSQGQTQEEETTLEENSHDKMTGNGDSSPQQQQFMQQLQMLQMQHQHLQNMSATDLSAMATMAHQMALGMVMMPMMPMMGGGNNASSTNTTNESDTNGTNETSHHEEQATADGSSTDFQHLSAAESLGLVSQGNTDMAFSMNDDTPKRKRGRPPKSTVDVRKTEQEKNIKQFPIWGYNMPMPFLPNMSNTNGNESIEEQTMKEEEEEAMRSGKPSKKKTRGTGRPRGRPRTRPRPGDIIQRVKPPAIAPANFPGMNEYLAQRMAEWKATQSTTEENARLGTMTATLLSEHE